MRIRFIAALLFLCAQPALAEPIRDEPAQPSYRTPAYLAVPTYDNSLVFYIDPRTLTTIGEFCNPLKNYYGDKNLPENLKQHFSHWQAWECPRSLPDDDDEYSRTHGGLNQPPNYRVLNRMWCPYDYGIVQWR